MSILIVAIHVIVCIALIMIVLLQTGKGADMGAAFGGGGSQTLFGATGASSFLSKATTIAAVVFMVTSLALAYVSSHNTGASIMKEVSTPVTQPAEEVTPSAEKATKPAQESAESPANAPETKETDSEPSQ